MQAQVVHPDVNVITPRDAGRSAIQGGARIDRITGAIVWLSYCALISAGITVMGW